MEKAEDYEPKKKKLKTHQYSNLNENSDSSLNKESSEDQKQAFEGANDSVEKSENVEKEGKGERSEKSEKGEKDEKKEEDNEKEKSSEFSSFVAAHYNSVESGLDKRNNSRIYYLRNFNNWVKSLFIKENAWKLQDNQRNLKVLDLCCGKGGDLFKWAKVNIRYMVCADIAELSLEQYKTRYNDYKEKCQKNQKHCNLECEFVAADCTRMRLRGKYRDPSIQFDIVSCQFSFHYCFESLPQAECMLKNASECLRPGGLFIGTIPNANEIVKRLKQSKSNSFKNKVFALEMCCDEPYPLFAAKYNFYLEGVVNCPEFLVHFPTFERLALKFGLKLIKKEKFTDFFERKRKSRDGELVLKKIKALETYIYSAKEKNLVGDWKDYMHAKIFCEENNVEQVGTLSQFEQNIIVRTGVSVLCSHLSQPHSR